MARGISSMFTFAYDLIAKWWEGIIYFECLDLFPLLLLLFLVYKAHDKKSEDISINTHYGLRVYGILFALSSHHFSRSYKRVCRAHVFCKSGRAATIVRIELQGEITLTHGDLKSSRDAGVGERFKATSLWYSVDHDTSKWCENLSRIFV